MRKLLNRAERAERLARMLQLEAELRAEAQEPGQALEPAARDAENRAHGNRVRALTGDAMLANIKRGGRIQ